MTTKKVNSYNVASNYEHDEGVQTYDKKDLHNPP